MLQRPGECPRARNSSACQAEAPGARGSKGLAMLGLLAMRQRIRAPLRFARPPSRTSQQGTRLRSAVTARRRVAVKSSAAGSPHSSPITPDRPEHLTPSSIAHSAARESRASTWISSMPPSPGGWMRPLSRIAMRSCTQSKGLPRSTCGRRKPVQPASRGAAANSSDKVGLGGAGRDQRAPSRGASGGDPDAGDWAGPERAGTAPPATRDKPFATRLTTFLFYFCSFSLD